MRLHDRLIINEAGGFAGTEEWAEIDRELKKAIEAIVWPPGSDEFTIPPLRKGNGVKPVKDAFVTVLEDYGWLTEERISLVQDVRPGPVDAVKQLPDGRSFLVEWETGNVSSSHRSVNRILSATDEGLAAGGALVVVRRATLYPYMTDRIGNDTELQPYFKLWSRHPLSFGLLAVYVVDYDRTDETVPPISKGTDGRALV